MVAILFELWHLHKDKHKDTAYKISSQKKVLVCPQKTLAFLKPFTSQGCL